MGPTNRLPVSSLLIALLVVACSSAEPAHRQAKAGAPDSSTFDTLLARLRTGSGPIREEAAAALGQPGPRLDEQVAALADALRDTNVQLSSTAAWALSQLGAPSLPVLVHALRDYQPSVRYNAVYALGELGQAAIPARDAVKKALLDPDQTVRKMAEWSMAQLGPQPSRRAGGAELGSFDDLSTGLQGRNPRERLNAVQRYQPYAGDADRSIPLLIRTLGDEDARVRAAAGNILVTLGPAAQKALSTALGDSNPLVRREASVTLVRMSGKLQ